MLSRKEENVKKKSVGLILSLVVILALGGSGAYWLFSNRQPYKDRQTAFIKALEEQDYQNLSDSLSEESIKESGYQKQEIIDKYEAIFKGLGIQDVVAQEVKIKKGQEKGHFILSYDLVMETPLGELRDSYQATLVKENKDYQVVWSPSLIFSEMTGKDQVLLELDTPARGTIKDRQGDALATNREVPQIGIIPGQLGEGEEREENIRKISQALDFPIESIKEILKASWIKEDHFVPLKPLIDETIEISGLAGVTLGKTLIRYYPLKEAGAHLIGYTGQVTAEDIEKNPDLKANQLIGKTGLEAAFDKQLRGSEGGRLKIVEEKGKTKRILLEQGAVEGQDIEITIDSKTQQLAYQQISEVEGATVVMDPLIGDLLAVVSSPSFNPNKMANSISKKEYDAYVTNEKQPFLARYSTGYAPGSTFKTITAAIGLDAGITTPNKTKKIQGLKWQKDESWGGYWVTRVANVDEVDMTKALIYSDNIYFAQEGLEMGEQLFRNGLSKFQLTEALDLPLDIMPGQLSNEKAFHNEILLADTAYGQGELLISPIKQASIYSVFDNQGKMTLPRLLMTQEQQQVENVVTSSSAKEVKAAMLKVVSDENGTAHLLASSAYQLAAKTGTAEIKSEQDTKGAENSFLLGFNGQTNQNLIISLVQNPETGQSAVSLNQELVNYLMTPE